MGQRVTFDDGKYVDFDGDDPISDEDIAWAEQQVYGNTPAKPKGPSRADRIGNFGTDTLGVGLSVGGTQTPLKLGDLEAGVNMLTGLPGMVAGGISGLGSFIQSGGNIDKANETLDTVSTAVNDRIQYEPRSARGKEAAEAFAWANKTLSEKSGEIVSDATGGSNAGQLAGSLGFDILSNLIPLSPALKAKAKPKPTEVNTSAVRAKEILDQKKAAAEAPKPVETPPPLLPEGPPELHPELKAEAQGMPPLLPETPVEAPLPSINPDMAPTLPKRGRKPVEAETGLPEIDPHMIGERAVDGLEVTPLTDINAPKGPRNAADGSFPEPKKSWFVSAEGADGLIDLKGTLDRVLETPRSKENFPGYKDLSAKLLQHLDETGLKVRMVDDAGGKAVGNYFHNPHEIQLVRGRGGNDQVLMHELVHATTGRWMEAHPTHPLVKRVSAIQKEFIKQRGNLDYGTRGDFDKLTGEQVRPHEFIAEARTNPAFQKLLSESKEVQGLWKRVTETIKNILKGQLKLAPKEVDALSQVLNLSDQIMAKQRPDAVKALKGLGVGDAELKGFKSAIEGSKDSTPETVGEGSIGKIQDYINKVRKGKNTTSPLFDQEKKMAALSKIPGMEMGAYIPKDVPWGDVKLDLRSLPDLPDATAWDMFIGSKEMAASLKRNPAMYAIGQWFTNARKRAELYDQVALKPLEKDIMKTVRKGEAASVMAVMKEESYAKMRLTPEELTEVLSPQQVEVYNKLRAEFDAALAIQNKALADNGRKPITPHEAYISSRWGGQWRTKVVDKDGNVVWWIAEKTKAKAKHALEYLKANHPDLDYAKSKVEYKNKSMGSEGKDTLNGYREMLQILDEDAPLTKKLQELYETKLEKEGYRSHGHDKHFEPKGGTKGFHGERPWVNDAADVKAFFESQLSYLRESHLWAEQQTAIANTKKMLYDTELQESHKNTLDWVRETARNEIGSDTAQWVRSLEHKLFKTLGQDPSVANKGISTAKAYFYSTKLGFFNAPFALMSVVQPVFTIPHHMRLTERGYKHNPAITAYDAATMTAATILPKLVGDAKESVMGGKSFGPVPYIPRLYKDAFKYMEANGIVNLNQYSDVGHIQRSPAVSKAMDVMNYSITAPEKIARTTAFMGYVSHLDQSGKFKDNDIGMFQKAEELTNLSMANFHHTERAPAFNKAGMAGNALVTLQTFKINQLNQLRDFAKKGTQGESRKPFYAMLAIQITMAGMMGLYGVEQAEWMWKWMKKGMNEAGIYDEDLMDFSPKKWMLENMDSLMSMGVVSQIMGGKDYHSRLDQGTILDPTLAGLMPFVSDIVEQGKDVLAFAVDPTSEKLDRAAYSVTPSSLKGYAEMNLPTMTGKPGQGDAFSADRPDEPLYKRTQADKDARGTPFHGVPTLTEAREKTAAFKRRETEQLRTRQLAIQTEKFDAASRQNNIEDMSKAIRKVATLGGDWEAMIDGQIAQLEKRATTADEKMLLKASDVNASIQTLLKVKRQLEATKKLRENH